MARPAAAPPPRPRVLACILIALQLALMLALAHGAARAQTVYSCVRDGARVFQDRACGADQRVIELAPAVDAQQPAPVRQMLDAWDARTAARRPRARTAQGLPGAARDASAAAAPRSWRCSAANGEVFYSHARCPGAIVVAATDAGVGARSAPQRLAVRAEPVDRREACREMRRAGASTRRGHERDALADTYERNLGRDPCA